MCKKYSIAPNECYGWFTGKTADGFQALMGLDINAEICVLFDSKGALIETIERCFDREGQPVAEPITDLPFSLSESGKKKVGRRFQKWLRETIVDEQVITVEEFGVDSRFIGIEPVPSNYMDFLEEPDSVEDEEKEELPRLIEEWEESGLFVFWWNEDYWMNSDGSVNTH